MGAPKRVKIAVLSMISLTVIILGFSYSRLPDQIPIFFNHPMTEGGFGQKQMLWELVFVFVLVEIFLFWLIRVTSGHFSALASIAKNPERARKLNAEILGLTALLCAVACLAIVIVTLAASFDILENGSRLLYPVMPIMLIGGPIAFLVWRLFTDRSD